MHEKFFIKKGPKILGPSTNLSAKVKIETYNQSLGSFLHLLFEQKIQEAELTNFKNFLAGSNSSFTPLACLVFYYILQNNFHYVTI